MYDLDVQLCPKSTYVLFHDLNRVGYCLELIIGCVFDE